MARILFVLNSASGGAAISGRELMSALAGFGHRCYAVLSPGEAEKDLEPLRQVTEDIAEIPLPWWNRRYKTTLWKRPLHWGRSLLTSGFHLRSLLKVRRCLRRWEIDLVHTNTSLNLQGGLAASLEGVPHVWHIREPIGGHKLFRFWPPEPILARIFKRFSDLLVVNSHGTGEFFHQYGLANHLAVVYNGIPLGVFAHRDDEAVRALRASWDAEGDQLVVAMMANLTSRFKRHDVFVRTVAELAPRWPEVRFVVVGTDPEKIGGYRSELEYAGEVKELAAKLGVADRIVWAGFEADIPKVMHALDLLVHPADRESFGRVAPEAMAARKAVVAADAGGLSEIVDHGVTGLKVPAGDAQATAAAVEALLEDPAHRRRMGEAGHRRATEHFSLEATSAQVNEIYQRLLRQRG